MHGETLKFVNDTHIFQNIFVASEVESATFLTQEGNVNVT